MNSNQTTILIALCFAVAGYLVITGIDGWGWFLFAGLMIFWDH